MFRGLACVSAVVIVTFAPAAVAQPPEQTGTIPPPPEVVTPASATQVACSRPAIAGAYCIATPGIARPRMALDAATIAGMLGYFYPPLSMRDREEGDVMLTMCVDANGRTQAASVIKSSGYPRLDGVSVTFARTLSMKPAMLDGRPVPFCGYNFVLEWKLPEDEDEPAEPGALPPPPSKP